MNKIKVYSDFDMFNLGFNISRFGFNSVLGLGCAADEIHKNFKACGFSKLVNLICTNLFTSSGHSKIKASQFNKMRVSGFTKLRHSTANEIFASGHFDASHCGKLGTIQASGYTKLDHCQGIQAIVASGDFSLHSSKVQGDVTLSGRKAVITDSTIEGKLECTERVVKISNSSIGRMVVKPLYNHSGFEIFPFWSYVLKSSPQEQVVELSGYNCRVASISFEGGAFGKVYLHNGAKAPIVTGAEVI